MRVDTRFEELLAKKERIERRRITRKEIADATGISVTSIQNWAKNRVTQFHADQMIAFCEFFDCDLSDLLILTDEEDTSLPVAV